MPNGGSCAGFQCDTYSFLNALNTVALCGFRDWRLPSRRELISIANYDPILQGNGYRGVSQQLQAFPKIPSYGNSFFWTSTSNSGSVGASAWAMYSLSGNMADQPKYTAFLASPQPGAVLAVRSSQTP